MVMVVVSLVRGIIAFLQTHQARPRERRRPGRREMQLKQNKMMFARIKYQALAIVVVAILLMINR